MFDDLTPKHLAKCIDRGTGTLTKRPSEAVAGQEAIVLKDAGDKPGTTPGRIYISAGEPVLPLRIVQTGPRKAASDDPDDKSTRSDVALSRFDEVAKITAPRGALSLEDIVKEDANTTPA